MTGMLRSVASAAKAQGGTSTSGPSLAGSGSPAAKTAVTGASAPAVAGAPSDPINNVVPNNTVDFGIPTPASIQTSANNLANLPGLNMSQFANNPEALGGLFGGIMNFGKGMLNFGTNTVKSLAGGDFANAGSSYRDLGNVFGNLNNSLSGAFGSVNENEV